MLFIVYEVAIVRVYVSVHVYIIYCCLLRVFMLIFPDSLMQLLDAVMISW